MYMSGWSELSEFGSFGVTQFMYPNVVPLNVTFSCPFIPPQVTHNFRTFRGSLSQFKCVKRALQSVVIRLLDIPAANHLNSGQRGSHVHFCGFN